MSCSEKIEELDNQIKVLEEKKKNLENISRKEQEERLSLLRKKFNKLSFREKYDVQVIEKIRKVGFPNEKEVKGFYIRLIYKNLERFKEIKPLTTSQSSVFYYRTKENILTYDGGGSIILENEPFICSDETYQSLLNGNIEDRYLNPGFLS